MTAQLAVPALMNVPLTLSQKVISIRLILMYAPIVVHVLMCALLKQFTLHKQSFMILKACHSWQAFFMVIKGNFIYLHLFKILNLPSPGLHYICIRRII
jgi:hypothetical protein